MWRASPAILSCTVGNTASVVGGGRGEGGRRRRRRRGGEEDKVEGREEGEGRRGRRGQEERREGGRIDEHWSQLLTQATVSQSTPLIST